MRHQDSTEYLRKQINAVNLLFVMRFQLQDLMW
jgi:hypothetical protein